MSDGAKTALAEVYCTVVQVPLSGLSKTAKSAVWRDRQIQAQAYNWGVEWALRQYFDGERIGNFRNNSKPLTKLRREAGSTHSLRLQRGGFWSAVTAVKKWADCRDKRLYALKKAIEAVDGALTELTAPGNDDVSVLAETVGDALTDYRAHHQCRVKMVDNGKGAAHRLRPESPDASVVGLTDDERSQQIAEIALNVDAALKRADDAFCSLLGLPLNRRLRNLVGKAKKAVASEASAGKRLLNHVAKGETRLFRARRNTDRSAGPALILFEGGKVRNGMLRLPGGTQLALPSGLGTIEDVLTTYGRSRKNLVWSGAVHIVDVTDQAGKVTRHTEPQHRKYRAHFLCRATAPPPVEPTIPEHSLGVDWGVAAPLVTSDGTAYNRHSSPDQEAANSRRQEKAKRLQRSMSGKTVGSRRYGKQQRLRQRLVAKNTHVRFNHQCHVAKSVVTSPGVRRVVLEDTKASNMTASAVGTKAFPTQNSHAKRGLNRAILETAPARQAELIERAGVVHSASIVRVNPAHTSLTCFVCGEHGQRETQTRFSCPQCGTHTHADVQAALNINERGNPGLYPTTQNPGGRDSRRKTLDNAVKAFHGNTTSKEASQTNILIDAPRYSSI